MRNEITLTIQERVYLSVELDKIIKRLENNAEKFEGLPIAELYKKELKVYSGIKTKLSEVWNS